jgi:hypothetical protein
MAEEQERAFEYDGVVAVGEVPVIIRRDSPREADFSNAAKKAAFDAYTDVAEYIEARIAAIPRYEDPTPLKDLLQFVADRLRTTQV